MQSSITNNLPIYVKVTNASDTRMVGVASPSFDDLESQVRKSFGLGERHQIDLRYIDDEQDRVCVSSEEELRCALGFFQGKTLHLFLTTKNAESEESTSCSHKKANGWAKHEEAAQELKKRLDKEGFDVPEKRCRKLVAKWNGNLDLAEEAVRQRKASRTACELLTPPGFFHRHHGPHRHHFGGHHGHHHPHHQARYHRHRHVAEAECEPQPAPYHPGGHHHHRGPHHEVHQLHPRHHCHHPVGGAQCEPQPASHFTGHHHRHGPHHEVHQLHSRHHPVDEAERQPQPFCHHNHKWSRHHHQHSRQIEALLLHNTAKRQCAHQALGCPKEHHGAGRHHHAQPRHCRPHHPRFCAHPPAQDFAQPRVPGPRFHHCFA